MRLGLTDALTPEVSFDGVRIANAPWADASRPFAALGQAVFQLAWKRYEGRWLVTRMILRDGEVHLLRQADGRRNWRLGDPENRGPGRFWFQSLEPHRIALSFVHEGVAFELNSRASDAAAADTATSGDNALVNRIDFDGHWRGVAFKGAPTPEPRSPSSRAAAGSAARHAEVRGARLEADGRAADLFRGLQIDAATIVSGNSSPGSSGDRPRRPSAAFRAEGRLLADDAPTLQVGPGEDRRDRPAGDLAWSRRGERPSFSATLASDATDLADLLWLAGKGLRARRQRPGPRRRAAASPAAARPFRGRVRSMAPSPSRRSVSRRQVPLLQSLKLEARLAAGVLAVRASTSAGRRPHDRHGGLDLRQQPPRSQAQLETRGVRFEALLPARDEKQRITGVLRAHGVDAPATTARRCAPASRAR